MDAVAVALSLCKQATLMVREGKPRARGQAARSARGQAARERAGRFREGRPLGAGVCDSLFFFDVQWPAWMFAGKGHAAFGRERARDWGARGAPAALGFPPRRA